MEPPYDGPEEQTSVNRERLPSFYQGRDVFGVHVEMDPCKWGNTHIMPAPTDIKETYVISVALMVPSFL